MKNYLQFGGTIATIGIWVDEEYVAEIEMSRNRFCSVKLHKNFSALTTDFLPWLGEHCDATANHIITKLEIFGYAELTREQRKKMFVVRQQDR
jgi:hypothetical protein